MILAFPLVAYLLLTRQRRLRTSPDRILALSWLFLVTAYSLWAQDFVELTVELQLLILSFVLAFGISYQVIRSRPAKQQLPRKLLRVSVPTAVKLTIPIALIPLFVAVSVLDGGSILKASEFRDMLIGDVDTGRQSLGIGYAFPIACGGWYVARRSALRRLSWLCGSLVCVIAVLSTSKIFLIIFLLYLIPLWKDLRRLRTWFLGLAILGLGAFGASHLLLEKLASDVDDGIVSALWNTFRVYLFGGIAALQNYMDGAASLPTGMMWKPIGDFVPDLIEVPRSAILPWTDIGEWNTNTYTAFAYWLDAFGLGAGIVMGAVLGAFYGHVFCRLRTGVGSDFYRTFLLFPLLFIFCADFYVPSLFMHVGFAVSGYLVSRLQVNDPAQLESEGLADIHVYQHA